MKAIKILVVQSIDTWVEAIEELIDKKFSSIKKSFVVTDSFDDAIDKVEAEMNQGELYVITSEMFHDSLSSHRETATRRIPDNEKYGNKLACMIKKINSKAKVYVFSEFEPEQPDFVDGFILKNGMKTDGIEKLLEKIITG